VLCSSHDDDFTLYLHIPVNGFINGFIHSSLLSVSSGCAVLQENENVTRYIKIHSSFNKLRKFISGPCSAVNGRLRLSGANGTSTYVHVEDNNYCEVVQLWDIVYIAQEWLYALCQRIFKKLKVFPNVRNMLPHIGPYMHCAYRWAEWLQTWPVWFQRSAAGRRSSPVARWHSAIPSHRTRAAERRPGCRYPSEGRTERRDCTWRTWVYVAERSCRWCRRTARRSTNTSLHSCSISSRVCVTRLTAELTITMAETMSLLSSSKLLN